ncbi:MAG TPA: hypothetical protein VM286_05835 [Candidatus Thermoplasmatota archaeon]|nr:hypothetical protein [Candidatus Thermoplasmatota archaeon]
MNDLDAAHSARVAASAKNQADLEAALQAARERLHAALPAFAQYEQEVAEARRACGAAEHAADDELQAAHDAATPAQLQAFDAQEPAEIAEAAKESP